MKTMEQKNKEKGKKKKKRRKIRLPPTYCNQQTGQTSETVKSGSIVRVMVDRREVRVME
jgi:hypothetical protein